jgi:hypothetical protein
MFSTQFLPSIGAIFLCHPFLLRSPLFSSRFKPFVITKSETEPFFGQLLGWPLTPSAPEAVREALLNDCTASRGGPCGLGSTGRQQCPLKSSRFIGLLQPLVSLPVLPPPTKDFLEHDRAVTRQMRMSLPSCRRGEQSGARSWKTRANQPNCSPMKSYWPPKRGSPCWLLLSGRSKLFSPSLHPSQNQHVVVLHMFSTTYPHVVL